jgi:hypothetical protein
MRKTGLCGLLLVILLVCAGLSAVPARPALAGPVKQTAADIVISALTKSFNAKDLNGCLTLMTDDAMVTVVNPSDLASVSLTNQTLTYNGKVGPQSELANFFSSNFTNGFTIRSTNFKTTDTTFNGPMQLAIRNFVVETEVTGTLEGGKIKTMVITDKSIAVKQNPAAPMPGKAPATGQGGLSPADRGQPDASSIVFILLLIGASGLLGLVLVRKKSS